MFLSFLFRIQIDGIAEIFECTLTSGYVNLSPNSDKMIAVAVIFVTPPKIVQVKGRNFAKLEFISSIYYSEPVTSDSYIAERQLVQKKATEVKTKIK